VLHPDGLPVLSSSIRQRAESVSAGLRYTVVALARTMLPVGIKGSTVKVLFATYPMAFHTPGGGEIQLLAYKDHLPASGVEVQLFDQWHPRFLEHDIVHYFSCLGGSSHFCAFVKRIGMPLVVSSSLWITEETKHLYPIEEIRLQLSLADLVVTNSNLECDTLSQVLSLPRGKFETVYNGVDDCFFETTEASLFREHYGIAYRFVLNVGNVESRKNQFRLAEAMKAFADLKLVLIGHARDPDYLRQVQEAGGDQVVYLGPLAHHSPLLRSAYKACELFALPSLLETPGLAALEAAAQNAVLVLTQEGCTEEYFGEVGFYVNPHYSESIEKGIARGLEETRATKIVDIQGKYSWTAAVRKLAIAYEAVVSAAN